MMNHCHWIGSYFSEHDEIWSSSFHCLESKLILWLIKHFLPLYLMQTLNQCLRVLVSICNEWLIQLRKSTYSWLRMFKPFWHIQRNEVDANTITCNLFDMRRVSFMVWNYILILSGNYILIPRIYNATYFKPLCLAKLMQPLIYLTMHYVWNALQSN